MKALAFCVMVACGGNAEPPPPAGPPDCAAGELVTGGACKPSIASAQVEAVERAAAAATAVAAKLRHPEPAVEAVAAVVAFHALPTWRAAATAHADERTADAAVLGPAATKIVALASVLDAAATQLTQLHAELDKVARRPGRAALDEVRASTSKQVTAILAALHKPVETTIPALYEELEGPLLHEIVFLRDHVCTQRDPATVETCKRQPAISAGYDYVMGARKSIRTGVNEVATELAALGALLDARGRAEIDRAMGRGPEFGQPCGVDGLCRWDHTCMKATGTCEHACFTGAMSPCQGPMSCVKVDKLDGTYCRKAP